MAEKQIKEQLDKIEKLIYSADRFNEMNFRMVLEGLVNKAGEDGEFLLVKYISSDEIEMDTRLNIIRTAGYILSKHFLVPLKKIIDNEENSPLVKEAVISVAKFNNRQALNILNIALSKLKNPLLLDVINSEISKIKKNNPLFALLPRFQEGEKDPRNFQVTLDILKRILQPQDASVFTVYLTSGRKIIEDGAFEILCFTGDLTVKDPILDFFQERFKRFTSGAQGEGRGFLPVVRKLKHYFLRHPILIDEQLDNLGTQLFYVKDASVREQFISIICRSRQEPAIAFISDVYSKEPELRRIIVREYSGNDTATDFLFQKYQQEEGMTKRELLRSLLKSEKGLDYFFVHYDELSAEEQENIVNYLPYGSEEKHLSDFIKHILQANRSDLKASLLAKIKRFFEFSVKGILMERDNEEEFFSMEKEYLDTVTHLFPVSAVKKMLGRIAYANVSPTKTKNFFKQIEDLQRGQLVFVFDRPETIPQLFEKVLGFGTPELNVQLLSIARQINTFDYATYKKLEECSGIFASNRDQKITPREAEELRKFKSSLTDTYYEIKNINDSFKVLEKVFIQEAPDVEQAVHLVGKNGLSFALMMDRLVEIVEKQLTVIKLETLSRWSQVFHRFPMVGYRIKKALLNRANEVGGIMQKGMTKLYESLPNHSYKVVVRLTDKRFSAVLRDQCQELIPNIKVTADSSDWQEGDSLICDSLTIRDFVLKENLPSQKLFLLLDRSSDFAPFKSFNPHPLLKPYAASRIIKEVLKEFYI